MRKINCLSCEYFYVTWDPSFPRGCKAYGFKTAALPSVTVRRSSGQDCLKFKEKKKDS
ncbi:uracil-DNA glycosylase [Bacillus sp. HMF5848]|nr:uracil-DNA glycosylase [Bacillus sp. HMF5848]RSK29008.1 uracil-DNA glycosylase [Bacillus sp. HMF5848]